MPDRIVLSVSGSDRVPFLQGLVTNNVPNEIGQIVYAALLTPQGKLIADFFIVSEKDRLLIDVAESNATTLLQRLKMYRLRADVEIKNTDLIVSRGMEAAPARALRDPRSDALGWRLYGSENISQPVDWDAVRVANAIPETGVELGSDTYILEAGFERLNGVDFKKGCFIGQEIVARMKHKTELRKGIVRVRIQGVASQGDKITNDGKVIGTLHTVSGDTGLAYLRFDRAEGELTAGEATLTRIET